MATSWEEMATSWDGEWQRVGTGTDNELGRRMATSSVPSQAPSHVYPYHIEIPRQGLGSGFVFSDGRHVVTNWHVVQGSDKVYVKFAEGSSDKEVEAKLVGAEPDVDIAVLELPMRMPPLKVGKSRHLQVGSTVYAIGNPFGFDQTMTQGIVSGLGRSVVGIMGKKIHNLVQTDAAMNPGRRTVLFL